MILGIDVGPNWARAAYLDSEGRPHLATLPDGATALPAVARQSLRGLEVGEAAKHGFAGNAEVTLTGCTRLLGRPGDLAPRTLARLPYAVRVEGGEAICNLLYAEVRAAEVYGRLVRTLVAGVCAATGCQVDAVALTVPAGADERYRLHARGAVEAQGLRVCRLVNQPTAALLAANLPPTVRIVAVLACGDGSTEVTLARRSAGQIEILATAGDLWLGSDELTWTVADQLNARFRAQAGVDVYGASDGPSAALGLYHSAAEAMQTLRHALKTTVVIDHGGGFAQDLVTHLHRTDIEAWLAPDFARIVALCDACAGAAPGLTPGGVDAVLLAGDGVDVPGLAETLAGVWARPVGDLIRTDAPNLAAYGAALAAAEPGRLAWDVAPFALGINCFYGERELLSPIILPNTPVPTAAIGAGDAKTEAYQTHRRDQTEVTLEILQYRGEQDPDPDGPSPVTPDECEQLGVWTFRGLRPKKGQRAAFTVTFAVDADGILQLLAHETATGHRLTAQIDRAIG